MMLDRFKKLMDCLSQNPEGGCDCELAFTQFECLAEQAVLGVDIHTILPHVADHLDRCHDCREEFEALVTIIRAERENRIR